MKNTIHLKKETNKGITLIALVITIIVLLILAAVSISTLIGENGILTKASTAKENTEREAAKEKVQMAVLASYGTDGTIDVNQLESNLEKVEGIEKPLPNITSEELKTGITVKVDGYEVTITRDGNVTASRDKNEGPTNPTYNTAKTVIEAKKQNAPYKTKTTITDEYNNKIVIPEGFKIALDSADDVTGGVVIEDATEEATKGSQFVWVPIGSISNGIETKAIELNRYSDVRTLRPESEDSYYQELATSSYGNSTAKDINAFKISVSSNNGYYIGRYEARTKTERTNNTDNLGQLTVKADDYVYNYVTQNQASELSQNMYKNKTFTSDLINSYVWDTTTLFISTYGNANYPSAISLNNSFAKQGTNCLPDTTQQDKQCNIWDMASNVYEWTTETLIESQPIGSSMGPCTLRGESFKHGYYNMFFRWCSSLGNESALEYRSFRVILYL